MGVCMWSRQRWLVCAVLLATFSVTLWAQNNPPCAICDVLNSPAKKTPKPVAQTTTKNTVKPTTPKAEAKETKEAKKPEAPALSAAEVNALRDLVTAQQAQLEAQRQQLDQLKHQMQQVLDAVQQANSSTLKVTS